MWGDIDEATQPTPLFYTTKSYNLNHGNFPTIHTRGTNLRSKKRGGWGGIHGIGMFYWSNWIMPICTVHFYHAFPELKWNRTMSCPPSLLQWQFEQKQPYFTKYFHQFIESWNLNKLTRINQLLCPQFQEDCTLFILHLFSCLLMWSVQEQGPQFLNMQHIAGNYLCFTLS